MTTTTQATAAIVMRPPVTVGGVGALRKHSASSRFGDLPQTAMARLLKCLDAAETRRLRTASRCTRQQVLDAFEQPTQAERRMLTLEVGGGERGGEGAVLPSLATLQQLFGMVRPSARPFVSVRVTVCGGEATTPDAVAAVYEGLLTLLRRMIFVEGAAECVTDLRLELRATPLSGDGVRVQQSVTALLAFVNGEADSKGPIGAMRLMARFGRLQRLTLAYLVTVPQGDRLDGGVSERGGATATAAWHDALRVCKALEARLPSSPVRETEVCTLCTHNNNRTTMTTVVALPVSFGFGVGLERLTALRLGPFDKQSLLFSWTTLEEALCGMQRLRQVEVRQLGTPLPAGFGISDMLRASVGTLECVVLEFPVLNQRQRLELFEEARELCQSAPLLRQCEVGYPEHVVPEQWLPVAARDALADFPMRVALLRVFQLVRQQPQTLAEMLLVGADAG